MDLVDSHCHLDYPEYLDDLDAVIASAAGAGVRWMLTIATHEDRFEKTLAIANAHENIFCALGVHPHETAGEGGKRPVIDAGKLAGMAARPKVVGLGETGLDYHYEHSPRQDQQRFFRAHIAAARQTGLPLIVHTRKADDDTLAILGEEMKSGPFTGLVHCFNSGPEMAKAIIGLGFYISLSGVITFKGALQLRETVKTIPLDRLLVETDAPYLAPVPKRGKRNEPAFTAYVAAAAAEIKGVAIKDFAKASTDNFFRLFGKAKRLAATASNMASSAKMNGVKDAAANGAANAARGGEQPCA